MAHDTSNSSTDENKSNYEHLKIPIFIRGKVSHGLGRGGKDLNIPTVVSVILQDVTHKMPQESLHKLPIFVQGLVVKGFGRGSKELGIPTANYPDDVVERHSNLINTGIYCGWAKVDNGEVHKMVMSVGWNPYYKNTKKSMETHIIHAFENDFYGSQLNVVITDYLRPEKSYPSLQELIDAIHNDISKAKEVLDEPENKSYMTHAFFTSNDDTMNNES